MNSWNARHPTLSHNKGKISTSHSLPSSLPHTHTLHSLPGLHCVPPATAPQHTLQDSWAVNLIFLKLMIIPEGVFCNYKNHKSPSTHIADPKRRKDCGGTQRPRWVPPGISSLYLLCHIIKADSPYILKAYLFLNNWPHKMPQWLRTTNGLQKLDYWFEHHVLSPPNLYDLHPYLIYMFFVHVDRQHTPNKH